MTTLAFRRLSRDDFPLLGRWLAEPHVKRWWHHEHTPEAMENDFGDAVDGLEPAEDWVVLLDGEPVGVIQYCRLHDYPGYVVEMEPVYPVSEGDASIDYFVGEPHLVGRGLGTAMIAEFCRQLWDRQPRVSGVVVPVNSANVASWRALQRAGFVLVARGEMDPDNPADGRSHEILRLDRPATTPR